jgi:hypothetical protein
MTSLLKTLKTTPKQSKKITKTPLKTCMMDGLLVMKVALLHANHKTGLMCTTVYLWCHNHLFYIRPGFMAKTFFCVVCILVEVVWSYRLCLYLFFEYQLIVGLIYLNFNNNTRLVSFESVFPNNTLPVIWTQNLWVLHH